MSKKSLSNNLASDSQSDILTAINSHKRKLVEAKSFNKIVFRGTLNQPIRHLAGEEQPCSL
jgi:hypothetical protein